MPSYLHGVEIVEGQQRTIITVGDTSIIALVGTASQGAVGQVKLITSLSQAREEYGPDIAGFTIPSALEVILNRVGAKVLVVNILENEVAAALMTDDKMTLTDDGVPATHLYEASLPALVDYTTALLAGIDLMLGSGDALGVKPNIILVPGYSQLSPVMAKMISTADKLNGFAAIDIVAGTVQDALAARQTGGTAATTSQAAIICYPQVMRYNEHENANNVIGLSVMWALAKAMRDGTSGYWLSPSNTELEEIIGLTTEISSSLTDTSSDTNLLNGQGIVTVFRESGMGTRIWGNWTAAFPSKTTTEYMSAPRAVRMAIRNALVKASITYMDGNATPVMVDMVLGDVNAFMRDLIGQGALVDGKCYYDAGLNPSTQIAQGHLTFSFTVKFAAPLERITFIEEIEY